MKADELRSKKPGDVILSASGIIPFTITEIIDGHVWGNFSDSFIPGECCRICGYMRRQDHQNKPCTGPKKITLRTTMLTDEESRKAVCVDGTQKVEPGSPTYAAILESLHNAEASNDGAWAKVAELETELSTLKKEKSILAEIRKDHQELYTKILDIAQDVQSGKTNADQGIKDVKVYAISASMDDAFRGVTVAFGLVQQGHIQTIEQMLQNNSSWAEIGKQIGWCPKTAEQHYTTYLKNRKPTSKSTTP